MRRVPEMLPLFDKFIPLAALIQFMSYIENSRLIWLPGSLSADRKAADLSSHTRSLNLLDTCESNTVPCKPYLETIHL